MQWFHHSRFYRIYVGNKCLFIFDLKYVSHPVQNQYISSDRHLGDEIVADLLKSRIITTKHFAPKLLLKLQSYVERLRKKPDANYTYDNIRWKKSSKIQKIRKSLFTEALVSRIFSDYILSDYLYSFNNIFCVNIPTKSIRRSITRAPDNTNSRYMGLKSIPLA